MWAKIYSVFLFEASLFLSISLSFTSIDFSKSISSYTPEEMRIVVVKDARFLSFEKDTTGVYYDLAKVIGYNSRKAVHISIVETPQEAESLLKKGSADGMLTEISETQNNENNEIINHCIVGEPTCPENIGEMMKIGRRGSMTAYFTIRGVQGHSAYPHRANNPLPIMAKLICDLTSFELDQGSKHFDPSTLAVTTIDTGNLANNVIPAETKATVNIRFNDLHTSKKLSIWLDKVTKRIASENDVEINTEIQVSGESFITALGDFSDLISNSVHLETGIYPEASTSGGTSDARFIKDHCPVVEFGLVGKTMHQIDERVSIDQVYKLKAIYFNIIKNYFA